VGAGETYLENVEVTGGVYVEGGGEDSVYFNNCTIRELVITKTRVHVALENGSVIEFALSLTGGNILEIGGSTAIGTLTIVGEGVTVLMTDNASVRTFNADAGDTVVEMAAGTGIVTANLNGQTTVSGSGTIREANIGVNGCEIEKKPETLRIQADITATVGGERVSAAPSPGGSTGGGWDTAPAFSSHSAPNKPNTPYGTAFFELSLPETVTLYATNGESCTAGVEWDESAYTPTQAGAQLITGTVAGTGLPAWAPSAISITVTVLEQPAAAVLVIKGETDQAEPPTEIIKGSSKLYTDLIEDRDGTKMTGQTVTWRIEPEVAGVHVTENGGVVTVDADCTATAFTLRALCGEATAVHTVEIKAPTAEKAPQVTDLTLLSLEHSGENTSLGYDLYVNWMTPDALPYPVRYLFEIVDDQGNVMGGIGSYEQDPADPRNLGLLWNWNIMDIIPPESGSYRLRVITQAVHDPALNSDPVYGSQTLDVTYTMDERPRFSHLAYLGAEGDMMRFGLVLEDGVEPLKEDEHYYIAFDYGTGWMDHFVERPSSWGPDALEIRITVDPARGGGNVAAERCSARVYRFYPIIFSGETVSITLSRALDLHVMVN
ncbi:MAG: Ig-like domain-containing protein, partial [Oscillospiraceae bacterium]|nr:Ig-like domain-containing protein [Oscillospiraceae bacterium]